MLAEVEDNQNWFLSLTVFTICLWALSFPVAPLSERNTTRCPVPFEPGSPRGDLDQGRSGPCIRKDPWDYSIPSLPHLRDTSAPTCPYLPRIWKQSSSLAVRQRACPTSALSEGTAWNSILWEVSPCTLAWPAWPGAFSASAFWFSSRVFVPPSALAGPGSWEPGVTDTPVKMSSVVSLRGLSACVFSELRRETHYAG